MQLSCIFITFELMETEESKKAILKSHSLRITGCRIDVLGFFLSNNKALSQSDLEQELKQYDRVTLYRTLNSFLESGILHKIPNSNGIATYGLCHETCLPEHHEHNHVHFKCNECGQIECLDGTAVPQVAAPKGYQVESINMIIDGTCIGCA